MVTDSDHWVIALQTAEPSSRQGGAPQKQDRNFQTAIFRQEVMFGRKSQSGLDTKTYWLTVNRKVISTFDFDLREFNKENLEK
jgi:hypothetical protein